jgi:hypothetical protein
MSIPDRESIPKNGSFTSVTDILLINESESNEAKVTQSEEDESSSSRKAVRFGSIEQREYNRIVGDHPEVRVGPPITFSWEFGELQPTTVDEYERQRIERQSQQRFYGLRRMSSITRKNMLRTLFEVSEDEILAAEREVQRIHKQRERTASQSDASAIVESNFRRAGRNVRRTLGKVLTAMATIPTGISYPVQAY